MNSPLLLTHYETCNRKGYWSRSRERIKLDETEMLQRALYAGLTTTRTDFGECAGEECYGLGLDPGLESDVYNIYDQVTHLSCLADIVCCAVRKPQEKPWSAPDPVRIGDGPLWTSAAYLDPSGTYLRRIALVSNWSDDRHYSEARSWFSIGEVAIYGLPMQQATVILGQSRNGKRSSPWAKGLLHPANKKLRFRKKHDVSQPFKDTWLPVWREDHDEIETTTWLQRMLDDGVLQDVCFKVDIPALGALARDKIRDMAAQKLEELAGLKAAPDAQLTGCDWPKPCLFRTPCHAGREPQKGVFRILE